MAEAVTPVGPVTADNLTDKLREIDSAAAPAPAPTQDAPPPLDEDWYDKGLPAEHGFLRNLKGPDVEKSFRNGETKIRTQGELIAQLRRENEQLRLDRAAEAAVARREMKPEASATPQEDPREAKIRELWFVDPDEARRLQREIMSEMIDERAKKQARALLDEERGAQTTAQRQQKIAETGNAVLSSIIRDYSGSKSEALIQSEMATVALTLQRKALEYIDQNVAADDPKRDEYFQAIFLNADNYRSIYEELYGPPQQVANPAAAISVPTVKERAEPPGQKKAAPPPAATATVAPLTEERQRAVSLLADAAGLGDKGRSLFNNRVAQRG